MEALISLTCSPVAVCGEAEHQQWLLEQHNSSVCCTTMGSTSNSVVCADVGTIQAFCGMIVGHAQCTVEWLPTQQGSWL